MSSARTATTSAGKSGRLGWESTPERVAGAGTGARREMVAVSVWASATDGVMKVLFAGDWHGDVDWAAEVIARAAETGCGWVVQVGDFGFGFFRLGDDPAEPGDWAPRCEFAEGVSNLADAGVRVVFIDGNHDNPVLLGRLADLRTPEGPEGFVPVEDCLLYTSGPPS